jgi:predicted secreted protein
MFCFNVKNMRHGIGNAVYDPQKYKKVKDSILEQVMNELEEKKELKWSIFNIGC